MLGPMLLHPQLVDFLEPQTETCRLQGTQLLLMYLKTSRSNTFTTIDVGGGVGVVTESIVEPIEVVWVNMLAVVHINTCGSFISRNCLKSVPNRPSSPSSNCSFRCFV